MATILMVWKPRFMTSHDLLQVLKRQHGFEKVGHTGTLDPLACGLMGVLVNENTKAQRDLQKTSKTYVGKILLGIETDTWDGLGLPVKVSPVPTPLNLEDIKKYILNLTTIATPRISAISIGGKRGYKGQVKQEEMPDRPLELFSLELRQVSPLELEIEAEVGGGTYVRALAKVIGDRIGCGAHLSELIRIRHHHFEKRGRVLDPVEILGEVEI